MKARAATESLTGDPVLAEKIEALLRGLTTEECEQVFRMVKAYPVPLDGDNLVLAVDASSTAVREARVRSGVLRPISEFETRPVTWLWPGRIPLGMLTLLEGDPGVGKSTLSLDIAAHASRGDLMPGATARGIDAAHVILLSGEDPIEEVIRPRLEAAGADLDRVHDFGIQEATEPELRPLTLQPDEVPLLEGRILERGAKLVIVDPVVAHMPDGTDTNSDHAVRRVLRLLSGLASRTKCAVVAVRHWRKAEDAKAIYRGGGSIGFTAAARSVLAVGFDPQDDERHRRVLAVAKSNVAAIAPSLAFRLAVEKGASLPKVHWQGACDVTASDLTQSQGRSAGREAEDFLRERVTKTGVPVVPLQAEAKELGIAPITLRRAKKRLGIEAFKPPDGMAWWCRWPGEDDQDAPAVSNDHLRGNGCALDDRLPGRDDSWEGPDHE